MIFLNMKFIKFHEIPWNSMELQKKIPWNSMEFHGTFWGKIKSSMEFHGIEFHGTFWGKIKSSMEFHGIPWNSGVWKKFHGIPWNFGSGQNSMEFHGIPWNHRCCSNVVQKVPWNSGESSMELFDQKVSMSIEKRFWLIFCYVMSNVGNAYKV